MAAALFAFLPGGTWYGPLFRHAWCREAGVDPQQPDRQPTRVFSVALVAALFSAVLLAWLLGPAPAPALAVHHGVMIGLAFVSMSFAINCSFARRSLKTVADR